MFGETSRRNMIFTCSVIGGDISAINAEMCASAFIWLGSMRGTSQTLDFTTNRVLMTVFKISDIKIWKAVDVFLSCRTTICAASETLSEIFFTDVIRIVYIVA